MEKVLQELFGRVFFGRPYGSNGIKIHLDAALSLPWVFFTFLNCTNGTKLRKTSNLYLQTHKKKNVFRGQGGEGGYRKTPVTCNELKCTNTAYQTDPNSK